MQKRRITGILIRILVIAAVAAVIAGILFFIHARRRARQAEVHTETFGAPELPMMWIRLGDRQVNPMYGYREEQDVFSRRASLTLLTADRTFDVQIDPYDRVVKSVRFEVTSLMDGDFVENGTADGLTEEEGLYSASIRLTTPILMDQEYAIRFEAVIENEDGSNEETVYYYTRVVQKTGTNLDAYLTFADRFYKNCITKENTDDIASYLESDSTPARGNFANVTIRSSLDQVTWGDLAPELFEEAIPEIKEINVETASFVYSYIISAKDASGNTEYYNVRDFYRLRTNQGEILLIDMNRTTEQIFDAGREIYQDKSINLGVRDAQLQYLVSEQEQRLAFVSGSDLWLYGEDEETATCVFTFRSNGEPDRRSENRNSHIRICSLSDDGVLSFVVYGYMVAGQHEGSSGVAVYRYEEAENQLEEKLFIASLLDPERLSASVEKLSYVNEAGELYLFTGEQILRVDPAGGDAEIVQDRVDPACIAAADNQSFVAWMNEMDRYDSASLTVLDTDTGTSRVISAPEGERIKVIGFFREDLVYGLAREADITTDAVGNRTFGIYQICIVSPSGSLLKTYGSDDSFFTEETWDGDNLELVLSKKSGDGYVVSGSDHIINNDVHADEEVLPETVTSKRCGQQVVLPYEVSSEAESHVRGCDLVVSGEVPSMVLEVPEPETDQYFVYAGGELAAVERDSNLALRTADEQRGIVVDGMQKYVYERGNWSGGNMLDPAKLPEALLVPPMDADAIADIIGSKFAVLNYSGCSVESIRYQLSRGYAVAAKLSETQNVLLTGYDIYENLWYYDPEKGDVAALGSEDAERMFAEQGNLFVSYYKL